MGSILFVSYACLLKIKVVPVMWLHYVSRSPPLIKTLITFSYKMFLQKAFIALLLENTCVTPTNRRTKIFGNNLPFLRNAKGNLSALFTKMLFIQQKKPKLNTQSDSIKAKLFI